MYHIWDINEKICNSLIAMRYLFSKNKTHIVSAEVHSGSGYIDNIFYPIRLVYVVVIHEYKFTNC